MKILRKIIPVGSYLIIITYTRNYKYLVSPRHVTWFYWFCVYLLRMLLGMKLQILGVFNAFLTTELIFFFMWKERQSQENKLLKCQQWVLKDGDFKYDYKSSSMHFYPSRNQKLPFRSVKLSFIWKLKKCGSCWLVSFRACERIWLSFTN